ncbi:MAG: hypothetical protein PWR01_2879 [Clostridiales bacterium]|nr:hypothetical protein [Clostridiales bacterium]MDN5281806.1 hypothetical protein [Candidatus Ozemobacter sp.]
MTSNRSGIRELQIARGLITLRWASIPLIFGFSIISKNFFGMSFQIEPIYVLCCLLAILNVFFTIHFSMLSRQMALSHGFNGLKRFMGSYLTRFLNNIKEKGVRSLAAIPAVALKIVSIIYLMLLEALKDVPFNLLSLNNVMHSQVIGDLVLITLISRYTGTTESPLFFLAVVPVTVAGAVMGFRTGAVYASLGVGAWFLTTMLVKYQFLTHIKFYSPMYGDLSQCTGWAVSNSFVMITGLSAAAFLAHKLTSIFKERIFYLNELLYKSSTRAISSSYTSEQIPEGWMITDPEGNVDKIKLDRNGIFPSDLGGKNLLKVFPELEQYGMAYVMQSVVTSGSKRSLEKIRITSKQGTEHLFNCRISSFKDSENNTRLLILFEDRTEEIFLKNQVEKLKAELVETISNLEKLSLENKENHRAFEETLKCANERAVEIEVLNQKLKALNAKDQNQSNQISSLMAELASVKATNDELFSELQYKQLILDELSEVMNVCTEIDSLTNLVETKARELFKLDNTCLHIFRSAESSKRINEILDTHKASPRLLDIPRNNPTALEPVLNEGRPVIINAQITPEKAASMAISNGPLQRLVAYIPVRHQNKVLGMMMLERFGQEENPEKMINTLSYYLKHCASAIKTALQSQELKEKNNRLNHNITSLHTQLDSIKAMVFSRPSEENQPFSKILFEFGKIVGIKDAIVARVHNDGSNEVTSRLDRSRALELSVAEIEIMNALVNNPNHKATTQLVEDDVICTAYPLMHGSRLMAILFTYHEENSLNKDSETFTDFCIRLLRDQMALFVMNEEKELWESFYRENLTA